MNILFVNKFYYLRGGAERSFFETKRLLEARGHQVIPFSMRDERNEPTPYAEYFVDNVEFNKDHSLRQKVEIIPRVIYFGQARRRLEKLLRQDLVDVAHLHNIAHQISPSILDSLKKFGIPVVQTLHDYKLICPTYMMLARGKVCERCLGGRYYHAVFQRCNRGSFSASLLNAVEMFAHRGMGLYRRGVDLFIAPSYFLRRKLMQDGMGKARVFYLPNFIDTKAYEPHYSGEDYCIYFGRLSREKGVKTLIQSMRQVGGLRLLIAGEGLERETLRHWVLQEKLSNIKFMGYLQGEKLKEVISKSLFVVLPSQCNDNCPFSILESFALGKAVIGSDIGGIPELITPGEDGLLFRPGDVEDLRDKIKQLAAEPEKTARMGMNARKKVERKFGVDNHYRRLMSAYRQVLGYPEAFNSNVGEKGR